MCSGTAFLRPRPVIFKARPEIFEAKTKAKGLEDKTRPVISVMKDSQVWVAQKVWNPQTTGSNNHDYLCAMHVQN